MKIDDDMYKMCTKPTYSTTSYITLWKLINDNVITNNNNTINNNLETNSTNNATNKLNFSKHSKHQFVENNYTNNNKVNNNIKSFSLNNQHPNFCNDKTQRNKNIVDYSKILPPPLMPFNSTINKNSFICSNNKNANIYNIPRPLTPIDNTHLTSVSNESKNCK